MKVHHKYIKDISEASGVIPENDDKYYIVKNKEFVEFDIDESSRNLLAAVTIPPGGNTGDVLMIDGYNNYSWQPMPENTNETIAIINDFSEIENIEITDETLLSCNACKQIENEVNACYELITQINLLDEEINALKNNS